jgi:hypothetical protein
VAGGEVDRVSRKALRKRKGKLILAEAVEIGARKEAHLGVTA